MNTVSFALLNTTQKLNDAVEAHCPLCHQARSQVNQIFSTTSLVLTPSASPCKVPSLLPVTATES